LQQEFITPHCPQQNGMVERVIRTLKEQCVHRHRFESLQHGRRQRNVGQPGDNAADDASGPCSESHGTASVMRWYQQGL
jgi:hypothetical protein